MEQLLVHLFGDYILQSDWMAMNKTKRTMPCFIHCVLYTLPFLFITQELLPLFLIFLFHFLEDRWYWVKYIIWWKNHLNPSFSFYPFVKCSVTGYYDSWLNDENEKDVRPKWITTWLYIFTDNTYHLLCNYLILKYCIWF